MARLRVLLLLAAALYVLLLPSAANAADSTTSPSPSASATDDPGETADDGELATPPEDGAYVRVRLFDAANDEAPVVGVTLVVTAEDGTEVGSAATDAEGVIIVPIPSTGTYEVTLDEDTLPEGIELADGVRNPIVVEARLASANGGLFPIGVQEVVAVPFSERLIGALASGIKFGLIVALAALGLSLIFGTTGLTNFAHGELITFGALVCFAFNSWVGLPVIAAAILAVVVSAFFGWLQDQGIWKPLRRRGTGLIAMMIVSIGLSLLLRNLYQYVFSSSRLSFTQYVAQPARDYGFVSLADKEIAIMVIAIVVIAATCLMLMKTRLGKSMRAVSDNPALAASSGMRVDGVISRVWILGTALTGLSGVLLAVNSQINFLMGFRLLLLVFAGVTLGGLGTIWGALIGSMVIGVIVEVGPLFGVPSSIKEVGALVVLILVLLIRPQGILGRRERVG